MTVDQGIVLWGLRVVIPNRYQERILNEMHEEHIGMCRMKALGHSYAWWPNIDAEVECLVNRRAACRSVKNAPPESPLHPWKWATWGIVQELIRDNGPQFVSQTFKSFMEANGIKHTLIPAYHLSSNGLAERSAGVLKKAIKTQVFDAEHKGKTLSLEHRLANFLIVYCNTPQTGTKESPAVLFLKSQLRSRLTLIKPNKESKAENK